MSEWFCSYFRKFASVCGQFSGGAAVVGIWPGHCCFILQDECLQTCNLVSTIQYCLSQKRLWFLRNFAKISSFSNFFILKCHNQWSSGMSVCQIVSQSTTLVQTEMPQQLSHAMKFCVHSWCPEDASWSLWWLFYRAISRSKCSPMLTNIY